MIADKQLPPEWDMPDLVRAVIGEEALATPSYMSDAYYDVMLHGQNSWLCQETSDRYEKAKCIQGPSVLTSIKKKG